MHKYSIRAEWIITALLLLLQTPVNAAFIRGYIRDLPIESAVAREERHIRVARRRADTILLAHRGASTLAAENTLEAYAAAMDYGADGCEVDIRRTADGVLVMFHDDMLDRLTDGFGTVEQLSYDELLELHPQGVLGRTGWKARPPTFVALLVLARQRAMLLHLDVKESGVDEEVGQILEGADMWDHVIAVNTATTPHLLANPKLKLVPYKMGIYEDRSDFDPTKVQAALAKPGQTLMLEDPRVAVSQLNRRPYQPIAIPRDLGFDWLRGKAGAPLRSETNLVPAAYLLKFQKQIRPRSAEDLAKLIEATPPNRPPVAAMDPAAERVQAERILQRAWAAEQLGQLGKKSKGTVEVLESSVEHASLHRDWMFNGLDAHTAARALGRLHATSSVPVLLETFSKVDPLLSEVRNPTYTNMPLAWVDWRKGQIISVLGELPCDAAKRFLFSYVSMDERAARELSIPQFAEATRALFQYRLTSSELRGLLSSSNSVVRGTALMECVDHSSRERRLVLRELAPWALTLPAAAR
jgi:hypothetical protein